jgi:hypothetical protein
VSMKPGRPPWMHNAVMDQPGPIVRRQSEVVAPIALTVAVRADIGREHESGVTGCLGATSHLLRKHALNDVPPKARVRRCTRLPHPRARQ